MKKTPAKSNLLVPVAEAPHIPQPQTYGGLVLDKCEPMPSPDAPKTFEQVCREETAAIANTFRKKRAVAPVVVTQSIEDLPPALRDAICSARH